MEHKSLAYRFAHGALWSLVGTVISQGLSLIAAIVTARLLGKVGFGELGMINSTMGMFGVFAGLGLGLTATKYVAEFRTKEPQRAGRILGLSVLVSLVSGGAIALVLLAEAPWIAERTINAPYLVNELRLGCGLLFLNALNGAQTGALAGFEAFKTIAKVNLLRGLISFPLMIAGVWFFGLMGAVGAMVVAAAAGWWLNHQALRQECRIGGVTVSYRGAWAERQVLWQFSLPALLSGALMGPVLWLANAIMVNQPGGYGELGLINAANHWRSLIMVLPGILSNAALPFLTSELGNEGRAGYDNLMELVQGLAILVALPTCAFVMYLGDRIMRLYGRDFTDGTPVLLGIIFGITIAAIGSAIGSGIIAKGFMWFGALQNFTWGLILLAVVWFFAPAWGARSFAFGFGLAYLILLIWSVWFIRKDLPRGMLKRSFLAAFYLLFITSVCVCLTPFLRTILAFPVIIVTIFFSFFYLAGSDLRLTIYRRFRWR